MKLKGDWDSGTSYAVGDVVRYTNGEIYVLQEACAAGITPIDTLYWRPADQVTAQAALFALDVADEVKAEIAPAYSKTTYSKGDIVSYSGKLYEAKADIGTAEDWTAAHWQEITIGATLTALNAAAATIPGNINDEAITLKDSSDNEYLITVDASGDTPELVVTAVTPEVEEGAET